jgi:hypothetical protein
MNNLLFDYVDGTGSSFCCFMHHLFWGFAMLDLLVVWFLVVGNAVQFIFLNFFYFKKY